MIRPMDETDVSVICKLVIVLKKLGLFDDSDDKVFWDTVEITLSRFGHHEQTE
jgi:hypothetical protein